MPFVNIKDFGRIKVKRKPPKFKKTIKIGNKSFKANKEAQKLVFASNNLAKGEAQRLRKEIGLPPKTRKKRK